MNIRIESLYERALEEINLINFEIKELKNLSQEADDFLFKHNNKVKTLETMNENAKKLLSALGKNMKKGGIK